MFYKKNNAKELDINLFKNPTSEYRGTPFWSWNCKLNKEMLIEQIEFLKQMGFGGFHMHVRSGMATEYLSDEYMDLIKTCVDKAKNDDMLAWLYDEDRWSSGSAGGYVTRIKKYRQKYVLMTIHKIEDSVDMERGTEEGLPYLFACYDIVLNKKGELISYDVINEEASVKGTKWYAYIKTADESGWFNNQTYVDTLSKEAIDEFIKITYDRYKECVGDEFGKTIPAIFTDEPNCGGKRDLKSGHSKEDVKMPWTTLLPQFITESYGVDIRCKLPEIFWNLQDNKPSRARYCYHDAVCELFVSNFMDNCARWSEENGIMQTGHALYEQPLYGQMREGGGEAMRVYRSMHMPGIDVLCNHLQLIAAKQTQSVVHQYNREAMMSELYGVTNWDFDFRGHKFQGDWQAALGVTVRVPHLSWVSMKGSAKRDYPASINYQSPWYKEYPYIEDHFARLNTALTRGVPVVNVGVIHPIESCWINCGPADVSADALSRLDENFKNITEWLLYGQIDFDYISESLLGDKGSADSKLNMGAMSYSTVVVPACETLRRSTFELLTQFKQNGGKLIFYGECPKYIDVKESDEIIQLYNSSIIVQNKDSLLKALGNERFVEITNTDTGIRCDNLIYTLRADNDCMWLFFAHGKHPQGSAIVAKNINTPLGGDYIPEENLKIIIKGKFIPTVYDTISGDTMIPKYAYDNGNTVIYKTIYAYDSILLRLECGSGNEFDTDPDTTNKTNSYDFKGLVDYSLNEPNVYLLDMAEYKLDDGEFLPLEEVLRIDDKCRKPLEFPRASGDDVQPWLIEEEKIEHYITLKFDVESEIDVEDSFLATEEAEYIELNGAEVERVPVGYYVDKSIIKYKLPKLVKGNNVLIVKMPFGKRISIEACYLLGNFGVTASGCVKRITLLPEKIAFGSITAQGFPFYGGNITYKTEIEVKDKCDIEIFAGRYRGSLINVCIDNDRNDKIVFPPYVCKFNDIEKGAHKIELTLYGNRHNTFGSLHNYSLDTWYGPSHWYAKDGEGWCYEYMLKETGILSSPVISIK